MERFLLPYRFLQIFIPVYFSWIINIELLVFLVMLSPSGRCQKCMRFNPDATVWIAKQRILCSLNQTLKDVLNYGLFQPASNGRDGKFLDEERLLREYPQPISKGVPCLEVSRPSNQSFDGGWICKPVILWTLGLMRSLVGKVSLWYFKTRCFLWESQSDFKVICW